MLSTPAKSPQPHQMSPQLSPIHPQPSPQLSPQHHQVAFQDNVQAGGGGRHDNYHSQSFGSSSSGNSYSVINRQGFDSQQGLQNGGSTMNGGAGTVGSLTVDTSHRMLSANMARSPSSGGRWIYGQRRQNQISAILTDLQCIVVYIWKVAGYALQIFLQVVDNIHDIHIYYPQFIVNL